MLKRKHLDRALGYIEAVGPGRDGEARGRDAGNPNNLDRDTSRSDGVIKGTRGIVIDNMKRIRDPATGYYIGHYANSIPAEIIQN